MNAQKAILSFWKDVEIFALPDLPPDAKEIDLNKPLPWELPFQQKANTTWRHTVYFGKHTKEEIIGVIDQLFENDANEDLDWLEKPTGSTCMAVLILNERG